MKVRFDKIASAPELRAARITIDRPPLNILDIPTIGELFEALVSAEGEPRVAAIVLAADGQNFSAGVEVRDHTRERVAEMLGSFHRVFRLLARSDRLTFSAVEGVCLGGGCELATFCDFVVAAEDAQFGFPEIHLACFPPVAAITLPRLIGEKRALELLFTGKRISAREAHGMGMVSAIAADVEAGLQTLLAQVFANSGAALRSAKRAVRLGFAEEFDRRLDAVERLYLDEVAPAADAEEGIRAFLEKRAPRWQHR